MLETLTALTLFYGFNLRSQIWCKLKVINTTHLLKEQAKELAQTEH